MAERLQKLISQAGIASRRVAEEMITQGRVTVNGVRASLGDKADPATDDIRVDGEKLKLDTERLYLMVNKPRGVVTTTKAQSQELRRTVNDLVPIKEYLYPVGRLDADSEGLILLTNDGDLAEKLTHPRYEHPKVYEVILYGQIPEDKLEVWRRGVVLPDDGPEPTLPADVQILKFSNGLSYLRIRMAEGRKRQIRRIASLFGYPVRQLVRTEFDTLKLADLEKGAWRHLTEAEVELLKTSAAAVKPETRAKRVARAAAQIKADEPRATKRPSIRRTPGERWIAKGFRPDSRRPDYDSERNEEDRPHRSSSRSGGYRSERSESGEDRPYRSSSRSGGGYRGERGGDRGDRSERPQRFERSESSEDRPRRSPSSRGDSYRSERPRRVEGTETNEDRPYRPASRGGYRGDRSEGGERSERPQRFERSGSNEDRPRRPAPRSGGGYRGDRSEGGERSERPQRFERSGSNEDRPRRPSSSRSGGGYRGDRSEGGERSERPQRFERSGSNEDRPRRPAPRSGGYRGDRSEGGERSERPQRFERSESSDDRPRRPAPRSGGYRGDRNEGGERSERPRRPSTGGSRRPGSSGGSAAGRTGSGGPRRPSSTGRSRPSGSSGGGSGSDRSSRRPSDRKPPRRK